MKSKLIFGLLLLVLISFSFNVLAGSDDIYYIKRTGVFNYNITYINQTNNITNNITNNYYNNITTPFNYSKYFNQYLNKSSNVTFKTVKVDSINFSQIPIVDCVNATQGQLFYSMHDKALSYKVNGICLQIGEEEYVTCRNNLGHTIYNGQAVYINGALGNRPTCNLSSANTENSSMVIGLATQDILDNVDGKITIQGIVHDVDTSAWTEGTRLYLSTISGNLTSTQPQPPLHGNFVGFVLRQHAVQGEILITINLIPKLSQLHDVSVTSPSIGNILQWNGTLWRNVVPTYLTGNPFNQVLNTTSNVTFNRVRTGIVQGTFLNGLIKLQPSSGDITGFVQTRNNGTVYLSSGTGITTTSGAVLQMNGVSAPSLPGYLFFRAGNGGNVTIFAGGLTANRVITLKTKVTGGKGLVITNTSSTFDTNVSSTGTFKGRFNWTEDSPYLSFNGNVLNYNETKLNSTIDNKIATIVYNVTSLRTSIGTVTAGNNVGNVSKIDGQTLNISEVIGGIETYFNFTGVTRFNQISFYMLYSGGSGHELYFELYNYNTLAWEDGYGAPITDMSVFENIQYNIDDYQNHVSGGLVRARLRHPPTGNPAHRLRIDRVQLYSNPVTLTNLDHDSFGGRDVLCTNHPWVCLYFYNITQSNSTYQYKENQRLSTTNNVLFNTMNTTNNVKIGKNLTLTSGTVIVTPVGVNDEGFIIYRSGSTVQYNKLTSNAGGSQWVAYSATTNAKPLIIGATTNSSHTIPTAGAVYIALQTLGTTAMTIDQTQKVGIGDTSPETKLDIAGNFSVSGKSYMSESVRIIPTSPSGYQTIDSTRTGLELLGGGMNAVSKYTACVKFMSSDPELTTENPKLLSWMCGRATQTYSGDTTSGMALDFATSPNTGGATNTSQVRMTIDSDGEVGIGTSTPVGKLDVNGTTISQFSRVFSTNITAPQAVLNLRTDSIGAGINKIGSGPSLAFQADDSTGTSEYQGRVSAFWINSTSGFEEAGLMFQARKNAADTTASNEILRIQQYGTGVKIGGGSSTQGVNITIGKPFDAETGIKWGRTSSYTTDNEIVSDVSENLVLRYNKVAVTSDFIIQNGTNTVMLINELGNVGIGNSAPNQKLHVTGNANITGAIYQNNKQVAGVGNCPSGQWVQNNTENGPQCKAVTASASAGGSQGNVQYNNGGAIAGSSSMNISSTSVSFNNWQNNPILFEDFQYGTTFATTSFQPFFGTAIASGTETVLTGVDRHPGIMQMSTSTTASSGYVFTTNVASTLFNGGELFKVGFRVPAKTGNVTKLQMGWIDTVTAAIPVDGVWINVTGTTLTGMATNNSVSVQTSTSYTLSNSATQWYRAEIQVYSKTNATFRLYNTTANPAVLLWESSVTTRIPQTTGRETGKGFKAYTTGGTTAQQMVWLDYVYYTDTLSMER